MVVSLTVSEVDLDDPAEAEVVLELEDDYSRDRFGAGRPLADDVRARLIDALRAHPTTRVFVARSDGEPVGIAICFVGFSTFAARPLLNVHDLSVRDMARGRGVGAALLAAIERAARAAGYCRLTLEVRADNASAQSVYDRFGFRPGAPQTGHWSKTLD